MNACYAIWRTHLNSCTIPIGSISEGTMNEPQIRISPSPSYNCRTSLEIQIYVSRFTNLNIEVQYLSSPWNAMRVFRVWCTKNNWKMRGIVKLPPIISIHLLDILIKKLFMKVTPKHIIHKAVLGLSSTLTWFLKITSSIVFLVNVENNINSSIACLLSVFCFFLEQLSKEIPLHNFSLWRLSLMPKFKLCAGTFWLGTPLWEPDSCPSPRWIKCRSTVSTI